MDAQPWQKDASHFFHEESFKILELALASFSAALAS
jgi:hypothetical protein